MSRTDEQTLDFEIEFLEGVVARRPRHVDALTILGHDYTLRGLYEKGLDVDLRLAAILPGESEVHYNLACSYSLVERLDEAAGALDRAIDLGYDDFEFMMADEDLANLRSDPRFIPLVRRARRQRGRRA